MQYAHRLRCDQEFVLKALEITPQSFIYAGDSCKDNREIVVKILEKRPEFLQYVGNACGTIAAIHCVANAKQNLTRQ